MQMSLHMRSVHLLTCTRLRLQTDLLHTHERGGGVGGGMEEEGKERGVGVLRGREGGESECGPLLSTQYTEELQPGDAYCSLPPAATVLGIIDLLFLLIEQ